MTLYIASSAVVGRRPRMSRIRRYSSDFRPELGPGLLVVRGLLGDLDGVDAHAFTTAFRTLREEAEAVGARAGEVLDRVLGVRHEPDDPAVLAGDAGDVAARAVGVAVGVAEHDPALALEPVEVVVGGHVAALAVLDRDDDALAVGVVAGPGGVGALDDAAPGRGCGSAGGCCG